jgi:outer membrane protein assembly factor BamB
MLYMKAHCPSFLLATVSMAFAGITAQAQAPPVLWTFDAPDLIWSSPAVAADGAIYFGAGTSFCAVTNQGSNAWVFSTGAFIESSPAVAADGTIYLSSDQLYAIDPHGNKKWSYNSQGGARPPWVSTAPYS